MDTTHLYDDEVRVVCLALILLESLQKDHPDALKEMAVQKGVPEMANAGEMARKIRMKIIS
jgi:hypothetical protein